VVKKKRVINHISYICYLSHIELMKVEDAIQDESWINAMYEKLSQFTRNDV
jgi:hypothetical protein